MKELYILRHGNTFNKNDIVRRVGARTDLPLSTSGVMQATMLAAHFAANEVYFSDVFSSPLKRAMMTAKTASHGAKIEALPFLTEIDYGPDEDAPEEDVIARIGAEALKNWDENAIPPPGWVVDPDALIEDWKAFFMECSTLEGPVLAVTSNGVARFALDAADKCDGAFPRKLATAAWGRVKISAGGKAEIKSWNERAS